MSEEQIKIWKQVEAKGLEKLENIEKAILAKEGFEEAHNFRSELPGRASGQDLGRDSKHDHKYTELGTTGIHTGN